MTYFPVDYNQPLFRPPSEANSLILQVTLGCSWNKCAFCEMYTTKRFKPRSEEQVLQDIYSVAEATQDVRRVFLADGNPMVMPTTKLLNILNAIKKTLPKVRRVSTYALPADVIRKSTDELIALREAGLTMIYVGIESGDDEVLKLVNKGETFTTTVEGLLKAKEAGIKNSVIILSGIAGLKYSEQHAVNSARVLNRIQPEFASVLVLSFPLGVKRYLDRFNGSYVTMTVCDLLREMEVFVENTDLQNTVFRSNHASNYLVLKGILSRDKEKFMNDIRFAINNPELAELREEWMRGL